MPYFISIHAFIDVVLREGFVMSIALVIGAFVHAFIDVFMLEGFAMSAMQLLRFCGFIFTESYK